MDASLLLLLCAAAVRAGTPILFAALGELMAERSGILNLGIEGMMLGGALMGFMVAQQSENAWLGLLAAALAGTLLSLIHAFLTITLRANQVVSGLALTIFGTGLSGFVGKPFVGIPAQGFSVLPFPVLNKLPILGVIFFQHDPLVYLTYVLVPFLWVFLYYTRPGLHIRAIGEDPQSADAMGVQVSPLRYLCVVIGGLLAGVGGAYLSLAYTQMWIENMSAGRGWIALAMVIFGTWNPVRTALGAYLFGGVQALQLRFQALGLGFPTYLLMMAPYLFTIIVLVVVTSKRIRHRIGTPAALGMPYSREG
jgi:simple sugar transport system permease protein